MPSADDIPLTVAAGTTDEHGRKVCPVCGHPAIDEKRRHSDEALCVPSLCPAWRTEAVYDHQARAWMPTFDDDVLP